MKNLIIKINSAEERELDFFLNEQDSLCFEYTEHRESGCTRFITISELYKVLFESSTSAVQHIADIELTRRYNELSNKYNAVVKKSKNIWRQILWC